MVCGEGLRGHDDLMEVALHQLCDHVAVDQFTVKKKKTETHGEKSSTENNAVTEERRAQEMRQIKKRKKTRTVAWTDEENLER